MRLIATTLEPGKRPLEEDDEDDVFNSSLSDSKRTGKRHRIILSDDESENMVVDPVPSTPRSIDLNRTPLTPRSNVSGVLTPRSSSSKRVAGEISKSFIGSFLYEEANPSIRLFHVPNRLG